MNLTLPYLTLKIFEYDFETSEFEFEVPKSSIPKSSAQLRVTSSSNILLQLQRPIELNFLQVGYFLHVKIHQMRVFDNLPIVSGVFDPESCILSSCDIIVQ